MNARKDSSRPLRRGWTTGACATAAVKAALMALWGEEAPARVSIRLPGGEEPEFAVIDQRFGRGWAQAGIVKDAGDDPDVTHGLTVLARVAPGGSGLRFRGGEGVGMVTRPGLPVAVGEPAINPKPREMIGAVVAELAAQYGRAPDVEVEISIPGGRKVAFRTWNPRLGIVDGLSVLGTTGIVRPFSCSSWIASIHRGIDVARAGGLTHVAGATGKMSERAVKARFGLPDHALLDMGDFVGGMLKYLQKHPVSRVTIAGGFGKLAKLGQGAIDLHSARSQVDFDALAALVGAPDIAQANTVLEAYERHGALLAQAVAEQALAAVEARFSHPEMRYDVLVVDRDGTIVGEAGT